MCVTFASSRDSYSGVVFFTEFLVEIERLHAMIENLSGYSLFDKMCLVKNDYFHECIE